MIINFLILFYFLDIKNPFFLSTICFLLYQSILFNVNVTIVWVIKISFIQNYFWK